MSSSSQQPSSPSNLSASSGESDDGSDFQPSPPQQTGGAKAISFADNLKIDNQTDDEYSNTAAKKKKGGRELDSKRETSDLLTDPAATTTSISTSTTSTNKPLTKRQQEQLALEHEAEEEVRRTRPRFSELRKQIMRPMPAATKKLHEEYIARDDAAWDALGILNNKPKATPEAKPETKLKRT